MTQRTLQVEHPGRHEPSPAQIANALRKVLNADGLKRDGDYRIKSYSYRSGGPSTLVVDVPTTDGTEEEPEEAPTDTEPDDTDQDTED